MAGDTFMKINGIAGECSEAGHSDGWIEVISFTNGITQPVHASKTASGGRSAGTPDVRDFTVVKEIDAASPALCKFGTDGKHLADIVIEKVEASGDKHRYMMIKLVDVIVSSYTLGGGAGGRPTETVTFNFGQIFWEYTSLAHAGGTGETYKSNYNLESATAG